MQLQFSQLRFLASNNSDRSLGVEMTITMLPMLVHCLLDPDASELMRLVVDQLPITEDDVDFL